MIVYIMKQAFFELTYLFVRNISRMAGISALRPAAGKFGGKLKYMLAYKKKS